MSKFADMVEDPNAPPGPPLCAVCTWCLDEAGNVFQSGNRAFCSHPSIISDTGEPMTAEKQRFPQPGGFVQLCGPDGLLFEARQ